MKDFEKKQTENNYRNKGRIVTGWWDGRPIHRAMEPEERLAWKGVDVTTANLAIALLGHYQPKFKV